MRNITKKVISIILIVLIILPINTHKVKAAGVYKVANCNGDENGELFGGAPGDQTGAEYRVQDWTGYWYTYVLRYPNTTAAKMIAAKAIAAANNDAIGYDQGTNYTYYNELVNVNYDPSKIRTKCNTDCSSSTHAAVIATGHTLNINDLKQIPTLRSSSQMQGDYVAHGFKVLTGSQYTTTPVNLQPGDILVKSGHATVYVGDPSKLGGAGSASETTPRTGHTQKEAGETIAAWCIDFYNKHRGQCTYNWDDSARGPTYSKSVSDSDKSTTYAFDCVGFVSFALHHAIGIGPQTFSCAVVPPQNSPWGTYWKELHPNNQAVGIGSYKGMQISKSEWQPGDVIIMGHHVAIYVGDGKTIGMYRDQYGGLFYGSADADCNSNGGYSGYVARVNSTAAKNANFAYLAGAGSGAEEQVEFSYPIDDIIVNLDEQNFEFSGTAKSVTYSGSKKAGEWIFSLFSQFIDFIVGLITNGIKDSVLGWAMTFESALDASLKFVEGAD